MKTIAIISQKGGVGKSTLAVHLATMAAQSGVVSLVLDADPQATASSWARWRQAEEPEVIDCASPPLIPSKLAKAAELGAELVVIDTPPHAESMAVTASRAADLILIPCAPQAFDLDAIQITADLVKNSGKPAYVVFTKGSQNSPNIYRDAREVVEGYGLKVAPVMMTLRAVYYHAAAQGKTAQEVEPNSKAAEEMAQLWEWVRKEASLLARKQASSKRKAA